jgi:carbonic anhydrase
LEPESLVLLELLNEWRVIMSIHDGHIRIGAEEGLKRLIDGNERFLTGKARFPTIQKDVLAALAREQKPFATIIGCSDSRVPPELIFDANFGELFVIRVAGNVLSPEVAGSLQYAGMHLKTPLFIVLGHENCGAIQAALDVKFRGAQQPSRIAMLVQSILPALDSVDAQAEPATQSAQAVEANIRWTIRQIAESPWRGRGSLSRCRFSGDPPRRLCAVCGHRRADSARRAEILERRSAGGLFQPGGRAGAAVS